MIQNNTNTATAQLADHIRQLAAAAAQSQLDMSSMRRHGRGARPRHSDPLRVLDVVARELAREPLALLSKIERSLPGRALPQGKNHD